MNNFCVSALPKPYIIAAKPHIIHYSFLIIYRLDLVLKICYDYCTT